MIISMEVLTKPSKIKDKKFDAVISNKTNNRTNTFSFGAKGYSDYTKHKDPERKERYTDRHKKKRAVGKVWY